LILCTGYEIQQSRFFGWIPIAPIKGEILHLGLTENFETIYNKSCFIIPLGNGIYKAGSTYDREDITEMPTQKGMNEISQKLDTLLKMNYEIVAHKAGIRPGTVTRRPLIGFHPVYHHMSIFNGLGTKGVSLAPFFSDQFVNCLEEGNNLNEEVDIKKYYSLYFNSHFSGVN
jgi:glycine/D-amino acid oxidase-like deaminating enzyme